MCGCDASLVRVHALELFRSYPLVSTGHGQQAPHSSTPTAMLGIPGGRRWEARVARGVGCRIGVGGGHRRCCQRWRRRRRSPTWRRRHLCRRPRCGGDESGGGDRLRHPRLGVVTRLDIRRWRRRGRRRGRGRRLVATVACQRHWRLAVRRPGRRYDRGRRRDQTATGIRGVDVSQAKLTYIVA